MVYVPSNPNVWQVIHPGGRSGQLSLALKRLKELASLGVGHGSISVGSYGHIMGIWSTSHEFWAPKKVAKRKGNGTPAISENPGWQFFSKFWPDGNLRGPPSQFHPPPVKIPRGKLWTWVEGTTQTIVWNRLGTTLLLMVQRSQTTWDVSNPVNNGIFTANLNWCSTGFLPSTEKTTSPLTRLGSEDELVFFFGKKLDLKCLAFFSCFFSSYISGLRGSGFF